MSDHAPIVFLPGWGHTPAVWQPVVERLRELAPHWRLQTPALPLDEDFAWAERAHLVGWSLGGQLALQRAQQQPECVASLTLIGSTPRFVNGDDWAFGQPVALLDDFTRRLADNPPMLAKRFAMLLCYGDPVAARDRDVAKTLQDARETDPMRLAHGLELLRRLDLRSGCARLSMPCQMIHGERDAVVPLAVGQWLQAQCAAELTVLPAASHALPLTHVETIAQTLRRFIGGHP